jgi:hypothetical protein
LFILYAVVAGLITGALLGGRWQTLGAIRFHWAPLIVVGFLSQVVLFSDVVAERVGDAGPSIYVASTLAVGIAVARNLTLPGIPLVLAGAASNMTAILANHLSMPAAPDALASLGKTEPTIYSNSVVVPQPVLELLTDRFALPRWLPFANVFSVGDVLLGIGVFVLIVVTMRHGHHDGPTSQPTRRGTLEPSSTVPGAGMH